MTTADQIAPTVHLGGLIMRQTLWFSALAMSVLAIASSGLAQNDRSQRLSGGGTGTSSTVGATSDNLVKRTWDFTKRFGIINLGGRGGCGADAEDAQATIDASNRLLADFLAGPSDPKKLGLERKKYLAQVMGAGRSIDSYLEAFNSAGKRGPDGNVPPVEQDICMAKGQRMSMIALRDGLAGIGKLYPDMAEVGPMVARAQTALKTMGDEKAITAMVNGNRSGSLASVRLKPALSNNAQWIAGFRAAFPTLVQGETILKIHPYSANWYIHKNELTSYPEYRQIGAWVAARKADGTCWIHSIDLWQDYTGSGYDSGQYKMGGAPQQILCENV
jgi:hypothetical protein